MSANKCPRCGLEGGRYRCPSCHRTPRTSLYDRLLLEKKMEVELCWCWPGVGMRRQNDGRPRDAEVRLMHGSGMWFRDNWPIAL